MCAHIHISTIMPHNYCLHWTICPNWKLVHQSPSQKNLCQVPEHTDHHHNKLITLELLSCQRPLKRHKKTKLKMAGLICMLNALPTYTVKILVGHPGCVRFHIITKESFTIPASLSQQLLSVCPASCSNVLLWLSHL